MSAFAAFVNYMQTALDGSGITIVTEKDETTEPPYIVIQEGPDYIRSKWLSSLLCQAWVVVEKNDTEPLSITMGKVIDKILKVASDTGHLIKYDYSVDPPQAIGTVLVSLNEVTKDMSDDPLRAKKVVTWELNSNHSL